MSLKSKTTNGEIINIGFGKPIKIKDILRKIRKIIQRGKPVYGKIKYRKDENMKVYPDIKKAFIMLKWKPQFTTNRGIKFVISSLKRNDQ